jgi:hypothetical protein
VPPRKIFCLNEKKRTVEKLYTKALESSKHVRFLLQKITVDTYNKAIIPVKSNTLQKFRYLVHYINKEKNKKRCFVELFKQTKRILVMLQTPHAKINRTTQSPEFFRVIGCYVSTNGE